MCGDSPEVFEWGRFRYQMHSEWHPYGIQMYWDTSIEHRLQHRNRVAVQCTGHSLKSFDAGGLLRLFKDLSAFGFLATRMDLCFDDYTKIKRPHEVAQEAEAANFTGFKRWKPEQERRRSGEFISDGVCFGARGKGGSGSYLRCYDKALESGGEIDAIRWEVEFTKAKAREVFNVLA